MGVAIQIGGKNKWGQRLAVATNGVGEIWRDQLDINSAMHRARFISAIEGKLGADPGTLRELDDHIVKAAKEAAAKEASEEETRPSKQLERITSAELDAGDYKVDYIVEDVVPVAQGGVLSGRFKTLKTTVGIDLVISAATGTTFLNRFAVPEPVRCGIVSAESGLGTLQETARRVARSKFLQLGDINNLIWSTSLPKLPIDVDLLEKFIKADGLQLLLLDPSYLMFSDIGESASNVFKMGSHLQHVTHVIRDTGCSIVLLNHNRKGRGQNVGTFDPPDLAEISMSGFAEWARFWLLLGPQKDWDDAEGRHWLWLRTGGSAGHAGLFALDATEGKRSDDGGRRWDVIVATGTEAKKVQERERESKKAQQAEAKEGAFVERLSSALRRYPDGETERQLRVSAGLNPTNMIAALATMTSRGQIEEIEVMKSGKKHPGWKLKKNGVERVERVEHEWNGSG